jgi:bifunctional DNase/RNase
MNNDSDLIEYKVIGLAVSKTGFFSKFKRGKKDYILILEQVENVNQQFNMIIGEFEAQELAVAIEEMTTSRPLVSELLMNTIVELGFHLSKVIIDKIEKEVYFSSMFLVKENEVKIIDSRPADSITQAVRFKSKIYIQKELI